MSQHTPRTMSAQIEAAIRQYPRIYGVDTREALLRELDAERAVSAELLEACVAFIDSDCLCHVCVKHRRQALAAIRKTEPSPSDSQGAHAD